MFSELKHYIEDPLKKQQIVHTMLAYSSPVVAVREKDGALKLCCDYEKVNNKTIPDWYLLPRVQYKTDGLNENKYFNPLDKSKTYHQIKSSTRM